jgi:crotonobetainyl-CoA:carnitine CoA-transferase CaiB-like acyl-CoA transferase
LNFRLTQGISEWQAKDFMAECNRLKIPAGIIQNLQEVFEMDAAKQILIENDHLNGLRTVISHTNGKLPNTSHILPPPLYGEHTQLVLEGNLGFSLEKITLLRQNNIIN